MRNLLVITLVLGFAVSAPEFHRRGTLPWLAMHALGADMRGCAMPSGRNCWPAFWIYLSRPGYIRIRALFFLFIVALELGKYRIHFRANPLIIDWGEKDDALCLCFDIATAHMEYERQRHSPHRR